MCISTRDTVSSHRAGTVRREQPPLADAARAYGNRRLRSYPTAGTPRARAVGKDSHGRAARGMPRVRRREYARFRARVFIPRSRAPYVIDRAASCTSSPAGESKNYIIRAGRTPRRGPRTRGVTLTCGKSAADSGLADRFSFSSFKMARERCW